MTRLLTRDDVAGVLTPADCLRAVEDAFRSYGEGSAASPESVGFQASSGTFHIKAAMAGVLATKINANFPENPARHQLPTIQGVIVLMDCERGTTLAILDSTLITALRTAAATAIAAKYLARANAKTLAVIGCGMQGLATVEALREVRPIDQIFAREYKRRATFERYICPMIWSARQGRWLAIALIGAAVPLAGPNLAWGGSPAGAGQEVGMSDSRREMIAVLPAPGPHPSLGDRAQLFDRLVGTWDADYTFFAADGTRSRHKGEVLFGWIIDGRALQDIWITYATDAERDMGTTVRFFDAKTATWRVVWVHPAEGIITTLQGGAVGDRIVLRGQGKDGSSLRWSFNDIQANFFLWRGEVSYDSGESWRVTGEYRMTRRIPGANP